MNCLRRALALAAAVAAVAFPSAVRSESNPSALVTRMADANPGLTSYTASLHVVITLRSMPYVNPSLDGSYYYRRPDKQAIVFNTVPVLAQQFKKIYPKVDPPSRWQALYDISVVSQSGGTTTLRLVPKHSGRVANLDVVVDDQSAMPSSFTWTYVDGGHVSFDQHYARVGRNYLIDSQTGKVDLPSYSADVSTTFSNFKLNVSIPDSVFAS